MTSCRCSYVVNLPGEKLRKTIRRVSSSPGGVTITAQHLSVRLALDFLALYSRNLWQTASTHRRRCSASRVRLATLPADGGSPDEQHNIRRQTTVPTCQCVDQESAAAPDCRPLDAEQFHKCQTSHRRWRCRLRNDRVHYLSVRVAARHDQHVASRGRVFSRRRLADMNR